MGADQNTQSLSIYLYSLPQICLNNTDARSVIDYFFPQPSTKCASTLVLSSYFSLNLSAFSIFFLSVVLLFSVVIIIVPYLKLNFSYNLIIAFSLFLTFLIFVPFTFPCPDFYFCVVIEKDAILTEQCI